MRAGEESAPITITASCLSLPVACDFNIFNIPLPLTLILLLIADVHLFLLATLRSSSGT